jgi:hypothetical protein
MGLVASTGLEGQIVDWEMTEVGFAGSGMIEIDFVGWKKAEKIQNWENPIRDDFVQKIAAILVFAVAGRYCRKKAKEVEMVALAAD